MGVPERATLYLRALEIELYCTDPLFVNPLLTTLVDEIGYYGMSAYKLTSGVARSDKASSIDTPGQDVYYWRLYGIDERSRDAWWLIVQRFTKCGWELLGPSSVSREQPRRVLFFSTEGNAARAEALPERGRRATTEPICCRAEVGASRS